MKKILFVMAAAAIAMLPITGAFAVDITNQDDVNHVVSIGNNGDLSELEVGAGETMIDVCEACTVQIGDDVPVQAQGEQVVIIIAGKLN